MGWQGRILYCVTDVGNVMSPGGDYSRNPVIKPQGGGETCLLATSARGTSCDFYFYSLVYFLSYLKSILISIVTKVGKMGLSTRESH